MNKAERVKAALAGGAVDHVPASFWFHFPKAQRARAPMAEAHLRYYEACDPDWLKVMNDTRYESPAGYVSGRAEFDLAKLARPLPLTAECYQSFLEGLRIILDKLRGDAPVIVTLFSPFATFNYMTLKQGETLLREQPEASLAALEAICQSLTEFSRACIDAGAWGVYYSAQGAEAGRFTPAEHARCVESFDRKLLDAIADAPFNLLHVCGEEVNLEPYWDYPVACINWATGAAWKNPDLAAGRAKTRLAIAAGLDHRGPLTRGPREEIRREIEIALEQAGRGKFLLAAGCTVPEETHRDLLKAAREICIELTRT